MLLVVVVVGSRCLLLNEARLPYYLDNTGAGPRNCNKCVHAEDTLMLQTEDATISLNARHDPDGTTMISGALATN